MTKPNLLNAMASQILEIHSFKTSLNQHMPICENAEVALLIRIYLLCFLSPLNMLYTERLLLDDILSYNASFPFKERREFKDDSLSEF